VNFIENASQVNIFTCGKKVTNNVNFHKKAVANFETLKNAVALKGLMFGL